MSNFEEISKELIAYIQRRTITDKTDIQTINAALDDLNSAVSTQTVTSTSIINSGPLQTSGDFLINNNKFTVDGSTGDTVIAGTLHSGAITSSSSVAATDIRTNTITSLNTTISDINSDISSLSSSIATSNSNITSNTNAINTLSTNLAAGLTTGNITSNSIANSGALSVGGNFAINANKFTVDSSTGNTTVAGTLNVSGSTALTSLSAGATNVSSLMASGNISGVNGTFSGPITSSNITSNGLTVNGASDMQSINATTVTGTTGTFSNGMTVSSGLTVNSGTTILGSTNVSSFVDSGNAIIGGNVSITGATTLNNTLKLPSYTTTQMNAIVSPQNGMIIYNTTTNSLYAYQNGTWTSISGPINATTATFSGTVSTGGITSTNGLTVSSGATNLQSLSATSGSFSNGMSIASGLTVTSGATSLGSTSVSSMINSGNETIGGNATISGDTSITGNTNISGNTILGGTLTLQSYTTTQMNAISSPQNGMIIYNTTTSSLFAYQNNAWIQISGHISAITGTFSGAITAAGITSSSGLSITGTSNLQTLNSGDLIVSGDASISGTLNPTGNFNVNTNKFNVAATSGNTNIAGTLSVSSTTTLGTANVTTLNATNASITNLTVSGTTTTVNSTVQESQQLIITNDGTVPNPALQINKTGTGHIMEVIDSDSTTKFVIDNNANIVFDNSGSAKCTLDMSNRTDGIILPSGTTGQRPGTSYAGEIRYNSTRNYPEMYTGSSYTDLMVGDNTSVSLGTTSSNFNVPVKLYSVTTVQMNAISSPQNGMMIYNTTVNAPFIYEAGQWTQIDYIKPGLDWTSSTDTLSLSNGYLVNVNGISTTSLVTSGSTIDLSNKNDSIILPTGTTTQRPTGIVGMIRYNTTTNEIEGYTGSSPSWGSIGGGNINVTSLTSSGNANIGGTLNVTGTSTLAGLTNSGNEAIIGTLSVSGTTTLGSTIVSGLNDSGNASITGSLGVTGTTTLGTANITTLANSGNATITGTLGVTGTTTLGTLNAGSTIVSSISDTGNASVGGTLSVTGTSTLGTVSSGSTTVSSLTDSGNASISGNTTIGGTLNVTGTSTLGNATITGNESVGGTLSVTGVSTLGIVNSGATTVSSLSNSGNTILSGSLGVTGTTTLGTANITTLSTTGNQNIGGTLSVTGAASLSNTLSVANNTTIGSIASYNTTYQQFAKSTFGNPSTDLYVQSDVSCNGFAVSAYTNNNSSTFYLWGVSNGTWSILGSYATHSGYNCNGICIQGNNVLVLAYGSGGTYIEFWTYSSGILAYQNYVGGAVITSSLTNQPFGLDFQMNDPTDGLIVVTGSNGKVQVFEVYNSTSSRLLSADASALN